MVHLEYEEKGVVAHKGGREKRTDEHNKCLKPIVLTTYFLSFSFHAPMTEHNLYHLTAEML